MVFDPDPAGTAAELDEWDPEVDEFESRGASPWRRWVVAGVALVVVASLLLTSLSNLLDRGQAPVADNGLAVCGFDYCVVQDAMRSAGLDLDMSELVNTILDDEEARILADDLTEFLGVAPVELSLVDRLQGRLGGFYQPGSRAIVIKRPANAWVVSHEVAHAVASGHGIDFQETLADLARYQVDTG